MNQRPIIVATLLLFGCEAKVSAVDPQDVGPSDGGEDGFVLDAGPACSPIAAGTRFGTNVAGKVTFDRTDAPAITVEAILLFPKGRVAGAPVSLVMRLGFRQGFVTATSTLDASLSATGLHVTDPFCDNEISAVLLGPTDGLVASVKVNTTAPSDSPKLYNGHAKLCATSPLVPTANLVVNSPSSIGLLGPLRLDSALPFDPSTVSATKAFASGAPISTTANEYNGQLYILPSKAFPPTATSIELDLSGARDMLGRSFAPVIGPSLEVPKAAVVSRTFDTAPPSDALLDINTFDRVPSKIVSGALWLVAEPRLGAVLGLGAEAGAKKVRFRHRFDCTTSGKTAWKRLVLISSDGAIQTLTADCTDTFLDETVPLPGPQPSYLQVDFGFGPASACSYPFFSSPGAYVIDDLAFVP